MALVLGNVDDHDDDDDCQDFAAKIGNLGTFSKESQQLFKNACGFASLADRVDG
jgi:hypothetical protein